MWPCCLFVAGILLWSWSWRWRTGASESTIRCQPALLRCAFFYLKSTQKVLSKLGQRPSPELPGSWSSLCFPSPFSHSGTRTWSGGNPEAALPAQRWRLIDFYSQKYDISTTAIYIPRYIYLLLCLSYAVKCVTSGTSRGQLQYVPGS